MHQGESVPPFGFTFTATASGGANCALSNFSGYPAFSPVAGLGSGTASVLTPGNYNITASTGTLAWIGTGTAPTIATATCTNCLLVVAQPTGIATNTGAAITWTQTTHPSDFTTGTPSAHPAVNVQSNSTCNLTPNSMSAASANTTCINTLVVAGRTTPVVCATGTNNNFYRSPAPLYFPPGTIWINGEIQANCDNWQYEGEGALYSQIRVVPNAPAFQGQRILSLSTSCTSCVSGGPGNVGAGYTPGAAVSCSISAPTLPNGITATCTAVASSSGTIVNANLNVVVYGSGYNGALGTAAATVTLGCGGCTTQAVAGIALDNIPLLLVESIGAGNQQYHEHIKHMAFDCGYGNAGCTGYRNVSNNEGSMEDTVWQCLDNGCPYGLDLNSSYPGPTLVENALFVGWQNALYFGEGEYNFVLDGFTCENDSAGCLNLSRGSLIAHNLLAYDSVTPVFAANSGTSASPANFGPMNDFDDCELDLVGYATGATSTSSAATTGLNRPMWMHNCTSQGFASTYSDGFLSVSSPVVYTGLIADAWSNESAGTVNLWPYGPNSQTTPVSFSEYTVPYPTDTGTPVNLCAGSPTDCSPSAWLSQMTTGSPAVVYTPPGNISTSQKFSVPVPLNVNHINCYGLEKVEAATPITLIVAAGTATSTPLYIDSCIMDVAVAHQSARPVIFKNFSGPSPGLAYVPTQQMFPLAGGVTVSGTTATVTLAGTATWPTTPQIGQSFTLTGSTTTGINCTVVSTCVVLASPAPTANSFAYTVPSGTTSGLAGGSPLVAIQNGAGDAYFMDATLGPGTTFYAQKVYGIDVDSEGPTGTPIVASPKITAYGGSYWVVGQKHERVTTSLNLFGTHFQVFGVWNYPINCPYVVGTNSSIGNGNYTAASAILATVISTTSVVNNGNGTATATFPAQTFVFDNIHFVTVAGSGAGSYATKMAVGIVALMGTRTIMFSTSVQPSRRERSGFRWTRKTAGRITNCLTATQVKVWC
ncbi:unnamed protein product [Sphagnum jensenii]|uniref:Uncharacterized protein n=1 Tax=Sphagnum jensenii TaxID=128206 RepID=A0ABP0V6D7_9BRYO